ncbi:MAG: hypothetical protein U9N30_00035 [Campylobacterota bacterium]|nr:hypothetical protein [Campylobacterota bacterium]
MRLLLLYFFLFSTLFAQINFKETRFMAALEIDRQLFGHLKFDDSKMIVTYTKPNQQIITYHNEKITILQDEELKTYTFEQYPQAQYMGLILKAIIQDNYLSLEELFTHKVQDASIELDAKPVISSIMDSIVIYKKDPKSVKRIIIKLTNKDTINIEIID